MSVVSFVSGGGLQKTGISTTLWSHVSRERTLLFVFVHTLQCVVQCVCGDAKPMSGSAAAGDL